MDISIEFVFLFACALLVLHFIISGCRYTNVEGYQCGTCPISTAKCPNKCKKIKNNNEYWCAGHTEECGDCEFASGEEPCLDTGATKNLYIGNLDLTINKDRNNYGTVYEYHGRANEWWVYKSHRRKPSFSLFEDQPTKVTDQDKLDTLNKLRSKPYRIDAIGIRVNDDEFEVGIFPALEWNRPTSETRPEKNKSRHLYFSDSDKDVYCLAVPAYSGWDPLIGITINTILQPIDFDRLSHRVTYTSNKPKIQYIGVTESVIPTC